MAKLLFGNNLEQVQVFHSDFVYKLLYKKTLEMGVELKISPAKLEVSGFDISKNIFLSKGYFSFQAIQNLSKCTLDKRLELDNKEYREGSGTTLQFYSNSHSLVVYDKLADLNKPNKRAIDKDRNDLQKQLFKKYSSQKQEIIRFEVRLRNKTKMKKVLNTIGYKLGRSDSLCFDELFNELLWRRLLNFYWQSLIVEKNKFLFSMVSKLDMVIDKILKTSPEIKPNELFKFIGIFIITKEKSLVELRNIYEKKLNGKNWSRFMKSLEILNKITETEDCWGWFREIDKELKFDK